MWRDESVTYRLAQRPVDEDWALLHHIDAVHGLYYLFMHAVFAVTGPGLTALRLPSVLATVAATAAVTAIGARLTGRRTGALAGTVYALLPITQQYAQEGRSYALVCAAVTWATYLLLVALDAEPRTAADARTSDPADARITGPVGTRIPRPRAAAWSAYTLLLALACWLNLFAVLALLAHGVTVLRTARGPRVKRRWAVAAALVAAAVMPLAVVGRGQAGRQLGWLGHPGPTAWEQFAVVVAVGLLCAWYARASRPDGVTLNELAVSLLVLPPALLLIVSLVEPYYLERYVLYATSGLALLAAAAVDRHLTGRRTRTTGVVSAYGPACLAALTAVAVLVPWSLLVRSPDSRKDDVLAVARTVRAAERPGDGVLFMPSRRREWLLASPGVYGRADDLALARTPTASHTLQGTERPTAQIRARMLAKDRIIALTDPAGQPLDPYPQEAVKRQVLTVYFRVCARHQVLGAQVVVYARPGHC